MRTKHGLLIHGGSKHSDRASDKLSTMSSLQNTEPKVVYWHEELPPLDGEVIQEDMIEAVSDRAPGSIERHGELWQRCYVTLMEHTELRLKQEIARLGGHYVHVLDEHIDSRRNDATGESWLHGRFSYVLYRRAQLR